MKMSMSTARIGVVLALGATAFGCSKACGSSSARSDSETADAAAVDPAAALMAEDEADTAIAQELQGKDISGWLVELRARAGQTGAGYRIAITGGGRVSRWDGGDGQGLAHDTMLVPKHKIIRLFTKFEKAHFAALPKDDPGAAGGHDTQQLTLALTRDGKTVAITRSGPSERDFAALVELTREVGDIAKLPHTTDDCQWTLACKVAGHCTGEGNRCVAGSDNDCRKVDACKRDGKCTARGGECVAVASKDCAASSGCTDGGRCAAVEGACVASAQGCKESKACREEGACGVSDARCAARHDADCRGSEQCKGDGLCTAKQGRCVAGRDADCRGSPACKEHKRCAAKCDRCVESADAQCPDDLLDRAARRGGADAEAK